MRTIQFTGRALLVVVAISAGLVPSSTPDATIIPWAWERRESLRDLDVTEVAYLAGTLSSRGGRLEMRRRRQPLFVSSGATATPVFRIETRRSEFTADEIAAVVGAIIGVAVDARATQVQIDFDATASQRTFYRALLNELRRSLPPNTKISITALASWCMDDRWLAGLPIDEAVPMLFQMGREGRSIRRRVSRRGEFPEELCRGSVGFSTNEPFTPIRDARRIYIFHPRAWTADAFHAAKQEVRRWCD